MKEAAHLQSELDAGCQRPEQAGGTTTSLKQQLLAGTKESKSKELRFLLAVKAEEKKELTQLILMESGGEPRIGRGAVSTPQESDHNCL